MKILALLTPKAGRTPADFEPHMVAEERALWPMYADGLVREMYFQPAPVRVSLVFEADSRDTVTDALSQLPMVQAGLLDVDLVELGPWRQLALLFADQDLGDPPRP